MAKVLVAPIGAANRAECVCKREAKVAVGEALAVAEARGLRIRLGEAGLIEHV